MTAKRRHPSPDQWIAWIQDPDAVEDSAALSKHLTGCPGCGALVETLRLLSARKRCSISLKTRLLSARRRWGLPSADVVDRVARLPRAPRAPHPRDPTVMEWDAPDVRGGGSAVADDARIVARSCPAGEISVMSFPPSHDGRIRVEGRVWLRESSEEDIVIVLGHEDHVVSELRTSDGMPFHCEELLAPGWQVEIHFPSGDSVVLGDPFAED